MTGHPLRAAIVGAGLMGRWHGHAIRLAGSRVSAILDRNEEAARALARRHGGARVAMRLADVAKEVDIVHVCTPTDSHASLTEEAITAGCHVLVEKPLACDAHDTSRLLSLADAAGVLLCPVHQFVFQRGVQAACERLTAISPIHHVQVTICSAGAGVSGATARDRVAWEILPHALSVLVRLGSVEWMAWRGLHSSAGEFRVMGVAAPGVRGSGQGGQPSTAGVTISMGGRPPRNELLVIGGGGSVEADLFHGFSVYEAPDVSKSGKAMRPFARAARTLLGAGGNMTRRALGRELAYPGLNELVRRFHAAAAGLQPQPIPSIETLAVARHLDSIRNAIEPV